MWERSVIDWKTFVVGAKDLDVAYAYFTDDTLHDLIIKPLQFTFSEVVCALGNQRLYQLEACEFMCRLMRGRLMIRMEFINFISYTYLNWIVELREKNARSQVDLETLRKNLSEIDALDTLNTSPNNVTKKITELVASANSVLDTASVEAPAQINDEDFSKIDKEIYLQIESAQATLQKSLRALEDLPRQYEKHITVQTRKAVLAAAEIPGEIIWNIFNDFCFEQVKAHTWPENTIFAEHIAKQIQTEFESYLENAEQCENLSKSNSKKEIIIQFCCSDCA